MAPFLLLLITFFTLLLVGRGRWRWYTSLRIALAAMFLLTAWAHFGSLREDLVRMVPSAFPHPELIVTITGVLEIAGAIGLLVPRLAPFAAGGLGLLLILMFPANVHAALEGVTLGGRPPTPLVVRTLLQVIFLLATIAAGAPHRVQRCLHRARDLIAVSPTRREDHSGAPPPE